MITKGSLSRFNCDGKIDFSFVLMCNFRPVLITDVVVNWKAMNWTKSFFVNNYGDKRVSMKGTQVIDYNL